jgi:hypothetical protein
MLELSCMQVEKYLAGEFSINLLFLIKKGNEQDNTR